MAIKLYYYYMPGCPYCVGFDPLWYQLRTSNGDIEFIRIDGTNPPLPFITLFPTLIASKNNGQQRYKFEGNRTFDGVNLWLNQVRMV